MLPHTPVHIHHALCCCPCPLLPLYGTRGTRSCEKNKVCSAVPDGLHEVLESANTAIMPARANQVKGDLD